MSTKEKNTIKLPDCLDLNLPDAPDFFSYPPNYTLNEMIMLCEAMLPYWNKQRFVINEPQPDPIIGEPFKL